MAKADEYVLRERKCFLQILLRRSTGLVAMWIHLWLGIYLILLVLMLNGKMAGITLGWYKDSGMESFVLPGRMNDPVFLRRVYRLIGIASIPVVAFGYFIAVTR